MTDLKPCPFCGDEHAYVERLSTNFYETDGSNIICCLECGVRSWHYREKTDAVTAWNNRAQEGKTMSDQCATCPHKGDMAACQDSDCEMLNSWHYVEMGKRVVELERELTEARSDMMRVNAEAIMLRHKLYGVKVDE